MYRSVVRKLVWPASSWMASAGAFRIAKCEQNVCRRMCSGPVTGSPARFWAVLSHVRSVCCESGSPVERWSTLGPRRLPWAESAVASFFSEQMCRSQVLPNYGSRSTGLRSRRRQNSRTQLAPSCRVQNDSRVAHYGPVVASANETPKRGPGAWFLRGRRHARHQHRSLRPWTQTLRGPCL